MVRPKSIGAADDASSWVPPLNQRVGPGSGAAWDQCYVAPRPASCWPLCSGRCWGAIA